MCKKEKKQLALGLTLFRHILEISHKAVLEKAKTAEIMQKI
jgi:hypothetical protein